MANIILIGFMGCGKSTIGKYISDNRNYELIDTDSYIEEQQNRTIKEIFDTEGEEYFRNLETECIEKLIAMESDRLVVAVGGGLPMKEINRRLLHNLGTIIYLKAKVDTLEERLKGDVTRPLLRGDLRRRIEDLFALRENVYEELADITVETDGCSYDEILQSIKEELL
ncbi:MAG: shikimate kinase [Butyrivibrio sp.]